MSEFIRLSFVPDGALQIPRGSQLLLTGPPGIVKTSFALRYLADRFKVKEPGIFATTLWTPKQIREKVRQYSSKRESAELRIVDGVSCVAAHPSSETFAFQNLYDLNTINLVLLQATTDVKKGHLVVDNLTTLMTYSSPLSVIKFLQVLCARVKDRNITGLYLLEAGVHNTDVVSTLRFSVDGVIEVHDEEQQHQIVHRFRLAHLRGTQVDTRWLQYQEKKPLEWIDQD